MGLLWLGFGKVHIYTNNIERTERVLNGDDSVKFDLNV